MKCNEYTRNTVLSSITCSGNIKSLASRLLLIESVIFLTAEYILQPIDLSPGDLLYYGGVEWLNISDFLGKIKKVIFLSIIIFWNKRK